MQWRRSGGLLYGGVKACQSLSCLCVSFADGLESSADSNICNSEGWQCCNSEGWVEKLTVHFVAHAYTLLDVLCVTGQPPGCRSRIGSPSPQFRRPFPYKHLLWQCLSWNAINQCIGCWGYHTSLGYLACNIKNPTKVCKRYQKVEKSDFLWPWHGIGL